MLDVELAEEAGLEIPDELSDRDDPGKHLDM